MDGRTRREEDFSRGGAMAQRKRLGVEGCALRRRPAA
jgi:hypothetical protein